MKKHNAFAMTRRGFLQGATTFGAVAAIAPSILKPSAAWASTNASATREVMSGSHWGVFWANVEDGIWNAVRPWEKDPHPSHQLDGVMDSVYSPSRIKYPMVRKAWLEGGPGASTETRGSDDFVRISWDEALDLIAGELKRVSESYGPGGVFGGSYGWKSSGKLHNCQSLLRRMLNIGLNGQFVNSSGDYSTGASQVIMPHVMGTLEVYEQQTVWPVVVENTEVLVFWAADPLTTCQISWTVADHDSYPYFEQFRDTGKKVIVIDPVRTRTAEYFGAEVIAIRPNTDVALMLGIAHALFSEGLHDQAFLDEYTTGFPQFLAYLTGESDGTPKTPEWAAEITEVPAETIVELARLFASNRTMLASGWSIQRQQHGEQAHWMLVTLASMLGQIGLPGGGFGLSYHYACGGAPSARAMSVGGIPDGGAAVEGAAWITEAGAFTIPVSRIVEMLENPGGSFDSNGEVLPFPDVRMAYWVGGNPFHHHQDRNRMIKAWQKLETVVVHDFQWTATARFADIVLPATTSYERNDIENVGDYSSKALVAMKKVINPVFEARDDLAIFTDLADRLGVREAFTEGRDEMAWLRHLYEGGMSQAAASGVNVPDFNGFWETGIIEFEIPDSAMKFVRYAGFRADPLFEPLGTPSGLIEIYSRTIERMGYEGCPPHPTWLEPDEWSGEAAEYPLHVNTSHPDSRLHSQLNGTVLRDGYAVAGREPCLINPEDANARGIADGDVVRVFNHRGQFLAGAQVSNAVRPGVIRVNEGGWYDPVEGGEIGTLCAYGDVNQLTGDVPTSRLANGNSGHTCRANVEKYAGDLPEVKVFSAPTNA